MLALILAGTIASAQPPEPPRTVNDIVIGPAAEFATSGPARVCLIRTGIDLKADETAYLEYLGIHYGAVRVVGAEGVFHVREGDTWREPPGGVEVPDRRGRIVERHRQDGRPRYLIFGLTEYSPDEGRPLVWVEGEALGRSRDLSILARISTENLDLRSCARRFVYGWDFILGEAEPEPSSETSETRDH